MIDRYIAIDTEFDTHKVFDHFPTSNELSNFLYAYSGDEVNVCVYKVDTAYRVRRTEHYHLEDEAVVPPDAPFWYVIQVIIVYNYNL